METERDLPSVTRSLHLVTETEAHTDPVDPPEHVGLTDPAEPWSRERIKGLLDTFRETPWGTPLPIIARRALDEVLLGTDTHRFSGAAGLPFLAACLDTSTMDALYPQLGVDVLAAVPAGLRRFVRFADRLGTGVAPSATLTKLEYIDHLEPAWQTAVAAHDRRRRVNRPRLEAYLRELALDIGHELPENLDDQMIDAMETFALLPTTALPDEALQLVGLDPDTALRVLDIGARCDHFFRVAKSPELRTAARRFLVIIARTNPNALRRPTARSLAAGICYVVIHGNYSKFRRYDWFGTASIAHQLGVSGSGIPARARSLLAEVGIEQPVPDPDVAKSLRRKLLRLQHPELLVSARRRTVVDEADWIISRLIDSGS